MIMIKKLKMWRNPGYTEECIEIPPIGSRKLPAADWVNTKNGQFYDLRPRKGSTLSKIELPLSFSATWDMSYLWMQAEDDAGTIEVFGWIRSVEQIAGSEEAVRIMWVPDYWRTCSGSVSFGKGVITKTSSDSYARPFKTQPRQRLHVSDTRIVSQITTSSQPCIIFTAVSTSGDITYNVTADTIGMSDNDSLNGIYYNAADQLPYFTGLTSDSIIGCWVCCYPFKGRWYNSALRFGGTGGTQRSHTDAGGVTHNWVEFTYAQTSYYGVNLTGELMTTDDDVYVIRDCYGTSYLTTPWHIPFKSVAIAMDIGPTEAYYSVYLLNETISEVPNQLIAPMKDYRKSAVATGMYANIPMVPVSVGSAKLSDYYVSGQREFDIETRRIEQEKQLASGISGAAGSALSGALTGALLGAAGGPIGAAGGALIGLGVSVGGSFVSNEINKSANDQLQEATEKLYANQSGSIVTIGSTAQTVEATNSEHGLLLTKLTSDAVSAAERTAYISNQGYDVEIPVAAATSFMTSGPLQIRNLNVTGSVPPAAKTAIKAKLEAGVFIVENNPTGTDPAI